MSGHRSVSGRWVGRVVSTPLMIIARTDCGVAEHCTTLIPVTWGVVKKIVIMQPFPGFNHTPVRCGEFLQGWDKDLQWWDMCAVTIGSANMSLGSHKTCSTRPGQHSDFWQ